MSKLNGQWLDIFRAGNYGEKGAFTVPMLAALAASYDPAVQEAPVVIGHPKLDAPAFGWVKKLRMEGDTLQAQLGEVDPDFESKLQAGKFKKRSVAFIRNGDALKLRHLGWLGAMPPHVENLRDAQFSSEQFEEVDFSEGEDMDEQQVRRTVRESITEFFANLGGKKSEGNGVSQADIEAAVKSATDSVKAEFANQLKTEREAREAAEAKFAEHTKTFSASNATTRVAGLIAGLKASKRWIPAYEKMGVPEMFASLASAPVEVEFSDGDKKVKKDSVQLFADLLNGIGQIVPEGVAFFEGAKQERTTAPNANGATVDPASVTFNERVSAYAKENKVEFSEAYRELVRQGERPESGSASAGAV